MRFSAPSANQADPRGARGRAAWRREGRRHRHAGRATPMCECPVIQVRAMSSAPIAGITATGSPVAGTSRTKVAPGFPKIGSGSPLHTVRRAPWSAGVHRCLLRFIPRCIASTRRRYSEMGNIHEGAFVTPSNSLLNLLAAPRLNHITRAARTGPDSVAPKQKQLRQDS